jgi:hypothetical protein
MRKWNSSSGHPEVLADQKQYRMLTQEHAYLSEAKEMWEILEGCGKQLEEDRLLLQLEKDPEMMAFLKEEIASLEAKQVQFNSKLETLLVPPDPRDSRNIILEIRAGTGGMRQLFSSVIALECTSVMRTKMAGNMSSFHAHLLSVGDIKNISWFSQVPMSLGRCSMKGEPTEYSAFLIQKRRGAFTHLQLQSLFYLSLEKMKRSKSTKGISG